MKRIYIKIVFCLIGLACLECTEPFTAVTETFEDVLVVEATITDELKTQEIRLSRTYRLEESGGLNFESGANIVLNGSDGSIHNFEHTESGIYHSVNPFQAVQNVVYNLSITDSSGKKYITSEESLPPSVDIDNVYTELITREGTTGVQVFVDSEETPEDANYFRYEYEEAYKIVALYYNSNDVVLENWKEEGTSMFCFEDLEFVPRPEEQKTCYVERNSKDIIVTSINGLSESKISQFPVRFISAQDYVLRDRYSILVKQFVQSANANNFYKILKELGDDGSLFIENQPGFVRGNIFSEENENEKVIGFFDVSSMSSKRIFFDYQEFDINRPKYLYDCEVDALNYAATGPPISVDDERNILFRRLSSGNYKFHGQDECTVFVVPLQCGDCSSFASSNKPSYWED
ncbi:DUF4249 domain-containing protein [Seonamhaeicola marinus]|uniref:DUF4249 domain-containing protein n=1 Tax=Seonamhaeicola marinus TaxID=1912246 RepID=UPI00165278DC|nr:DUF4249 domain-containing protein [Seonamhaeicola marinus]